MTEVVSDLNRGNDAECASESCISETCVAICARSEMNVSLVPRVEIHVIYDKASIKHNA